MADGVYCICANLSVFADALVRAHIPTKTTATHTRTHGSTTMMRLTGSSMGTWWSNNNNGLENIVLVQILSEANA